MDVSEFLLARIAEDEAVAQAALRKSSYDWSDNGFTEAVELAEGEGAVKEATTHIARWDPARVLAECEAKRQIVKQYKQCWAVVGSPDGPGLAVCDVAYGDEEIGEREALKLVLRLLALPYADHPDYDRTWAPLEAHAS